MEICIVGTGYVGLVTGACLAEMGDTVIYCDRDNARIASLQAGEIPFFEPGLEEVVDLAWNTQLRAGLAQKRI